MTSASSFPALQQFHRFVRLLRVEPILLLYMVAYDIQRFVQDQLIQDKLCLQKYLQSPEYCLLLPKMSHYDDVSGVKSAILTDSTHILMFQNIVATVTSVIVSLFIGQYIDQSRNAKRTLILAATAIITLENTLIFLYSFFSEIDYRYILVIKLLQGVIGCPMAQYAVYWSYVSAVTPSHLRGVRMACVMGCIYGSIPIATTLGGRLLNRDPLFPGYELRNYSTVYFFAIGSSLVAFILAMVLVDEHRDRAIYCQHFPDQSSSVSLEKCDNNIKTITEGNVKKQETSNSISPWKILTNLSNVGLMFGIFFKARPHKIRMQLLLSITAIFLYMFCSWGFLTFAYQYVERVFNWNTKEFSVFQTMSYSVNLTTSILMAPIILKVFKMSDLTMSVIALAMVTLQNLVRSLCTSMWLFQLSICFYTLNSLTTVGFRAYISNIIPQNELGSIFSMISIFEALAPMISSIVLSTIFRSTIDTRPTLTFAVMAICGSVGLVIGFVVRYKSRATLAALEKIQNADKQGMNDEEDNQQQKTKV